MKCKVILFLALAVLAFAPLSCKATPTSHKGVVDDIPSYAELAARHNQRVQLLNRVYSRGVVEITWRDDDGVRRFRQGDVDLYIHLPRKTALRVGKLGEMYLWLGSDQERYWLFDLVDDERVLYTGRHDDASALRTVHPLAMIDLIGLGSMHEYGQDEAPLVELDSSRNAWVVNTVGRGGDLRMYFDRATRLPIRVEVMNQQGEVISTSTLALQRYQSVPVAGVSTAALPRMATLVDIVSTGEDGVAAGEFKLALDTPTGRVDDQPFDRVFDLDRLKRSLRPARIEGE